MALQAVDAHHRRTNQSFRRRNLARKGGEFVIGMQYFGSLVDADDEAVFVIGEPYLTILEFNELLKIYIMGGVLCSRSSSLVSSHFF